MNAIKAWRKRGAKPSRPRRVRLAAEQLEERNLLSASPITDDPGWLAPTESQEYVDAIITLREMSGWTVQEPELLENGNWYLGPAGDLSDLKVPFNVAAADTTNTDELQVGGGLGLDLTGNGVTVGVWDGGRIRATHEALVGRVTEVDTSLGFKDHATHVAGTIGATGGNVLAEGMASEVQIRGFDFFNDTAELAAEAGNIQIANHSYGKIVGWALGDFGLGFGFRDHWIEDRSLSDTEDPDFGKYDSDAQALDDVLYDNPSLLSIWAAGNDRDDGYTDYVLDNGYATIFSADPGGTRIHPVFGPGWFGPDWYLVLASGQANTVAPPSDGNAGSGFDSLPGDQTAKNSLVIGAIDDITVDPYDNTDVSIAAFSSFGAPDDGRIKPDLVANGVGVLSSVAFVPGTTIPSNVRYDSFSGTSMAAPNTTGSAALLLEHYRNLFPNGPDPDSATLKGLLIQTAFDAGRTGPDYENGWGVVDAAAAANFLTEAVTAAPTNLLSEMTYRGYDTDTEVTMDVRSDGSEQLKVTIVWTDPAPDLLTLPDPNVLDDPTSVLVNDLDLWVTGPGGTYWPWTLDLANPTAAAVRTTANSRDNVEQVLIDAPAGGIYTIHVGATENDPFTQDFSLLVDGVEATSTAPRVTAVIVGTDPVTSHGDYAIPTGSGNQLKSVPVGLANTIAIEFSEAVAVSQGQLTLASALQGGADPGSSTAFSGFDAETKTATWTFNTFLLNQLELTLSDGITDTANRPLDGNFTSPDTIFDPAGPALTSLASGDGTTGGSFSFRFTVLPGDLNGDTEIDYEDYLTMDGNNEMTSATYQDGDVNGDGVVNEADYDNAFKANYGTILAVWGWQFMVSDFELDLDVDFDDIPGFLEILNDGVQAYVNSHSSGLPLISNALQLRLVQEMIGDSDGDDDVQFDDITNFVARIRGTLLPADLS